MENTFKKYEKVKKKSIYFQSKFKKKEEKVLFRKKLK
jgi:hypothetical protein